MTNSIRMYQFMQALFDDKFAAKEATEIGEAILSARSLRLTEIAVKMRGNTAAAYKRIQ